MGAYCLIRHVSGRLLCAAGERLALNERADDQCLWRLEGTRLDCAAGGRSLQVKLDGVAPQGGHWCQLKDDSGEAVMGLQSRWRLQKGPVKLASEHLAELRADGSTVVQGILDGPALARMQVQIARNRSRHHRTQSAFDGHFWMTDGLAWCADLARAAIHPLALWLLENYLESTDIHFCHQPIITTLKPANALHGTFPEGGWHSDYPYHRGVFEDDRWPERPPLGAQYNVCIDAFTEASAATQFVPGSHRAGTLPPRAMNQGGTRMGEGEHREARQMLAPAGAAIIYDARTWHRACDELNASGRDRIALLNAVAPGWVLPMIDKMPLVESYRASPVPASLTAQERRDVDTLCNSPTLPTPGGMPRLQLRR